MRHDEYVKIAQGLGCKVLQKSIIGAVVKHLPFFALGLPNTILLKLATWLAEKIIKEAEMRIFFAFVDFRTDKQASEFEAAMIHNHHMQLTGTREQKDEAEKKLNNALTRLVNLKL